MALEAVQAQAGHASIESTRIYLHLADDWLAAQYRKAAEVIDAQVFAGQPPGLPVCPHGGNHAHPRSASAQDQLSALLAESGQSCLFSGADMP